MAMTTLLDLDDPTFQEVSEVFHRRSSSKNFLLEIQFIEKVNNKALRRKFLKKKRVYEEKYGKVAVVQVFHGTKKSNIPSILKNNLDVNLHGQNRGHRFGGGVSFSALANYASHYCGDSDSVKTMLLCNVLISNIIEVPELKERCYTYCEPPIIEDCWPLRYDTTAKNKLTKDVIVKFENHTYHPSHVIHFKKISIAPQLRKQVFNQHRRRRQAKPTQNDFRESQVDTTSLGSQAFGSYFICPEPRFNQQEEPEFSFTGLINAIIRDIFG